MKRWLACFLSLTLLVVSLPFGALSVAAEEIDYGAMTADEWYCIDITEPGDSVTMTFTPKVSGRYMYAALSPETENWWEMSSTTGNIFDADGNYVSDVLHGLNNDFRIYADLVAGETYTLITRYTDSSAIGSYDLIMSLVPFVAISFEDIAIAKDSYVGTRNEYDEDNNFVGECEYYNHKCAAKYKLTMRDGTVVYQEGEGFYMDRIYYSLEVIEDGQSIDNKWEAGNTYAATVGLVGTEVVGKYNVTIEDTPIESIVVEPVQILQKTNGSYRSDSLYDENGDYMGTTEEYYAYSFWPIHYVITLKDGSVYEDDGFYYNGEWHNLNYVSSYDTDQSYDNQWLPGNTYTVTDSILGFEFSYEVEIIDSPIASIEVKPVELVQGLHGGYTRDQLYDEEGYFDGQTEKYWAYEVQPQEYIITLKDGSVYENEGFLFQNRWYGMSWRSPGETGQSYDNQWLPGNTYTVTDEIAGFKFSYDVSITELPIASIEVERVEIVEETNGYFAVDAIYDEMGNYVGETDEYFRYYPHMRNFTITLKDGTVYENEGFTYKDYYLRPSGLEEWETDQSYENQWTLGNTYTLDCTLCGVPYSYEVAIVESPIASIDVAPIQLIENDERNGYYQTESLWDENGNYIGDTEEYFVYSFRVPQYTITLKDGTVYENEGISFNDVWYDIGWVEGRATDQSYENQWTVGNTYTTTQKILGFEYTVEAEIIDTPIASIEFDKVKVIEKLDGYETSDSLWDENGDYIGETDLYYAYNFAMPNYTITLKDGSVYENEGFKFGGEWYDLGRWVDRRETEQSYENQWAAGNTYTVSGSLANYEYTINVEVIDSPIESMKVDDVTVIEGVHGYYTTDSLYDENNGYIGESDLYFGYAFQMPNYTITLKDGSVYENQGFDYDGEWYEPRWYIESRHSGQDYEHQWTPGNTYAVTLNLAGYDYTINVTVEETPVASIKVDKLQLVEKWDGYYRTDSLWDEYGNYLGESDEYYVYSCWVDNCVVTMKDGTVYEDGSFPIGDRWYEIDGMGAEDTDQSYDNQWTVGNVYTVTDRVAGVDFSYEVEIVESPIASVDVSKVILLEEGDGYYTQDEIIDEYGNWVGYTPEYFVYEYRPNKYTITLKDGTVYQDTGFYLNNKWVNIFWVDYYETDQSYDNQWTLGNTYTVEAELCGVPYSYEVEITDTPIASITVDPVRVDVESNGYYTTEEIYDEDGNHIGETDSYFVYEPSVNNYTIVLKDGRVYKNDGFDYNGSWYNVWDIDRWETDQSYDNQWTVGNTYTVQRELLGYEYEVDVTIQKPTYNDEYDYEIVENGVVIMDTFLSDETIVIPEEIDGMPVIGVISLGSRWNVRHLVIPDSVTTVGQQLFSNLWNLETVTFGSGISYLKSEMFEYSYSMVSYTVSEDNPYFCSVDGVLYNKAMDTLIAYPVRRGTRYTVPKTVADIDALEAPIYGNLQLSFEEGHVAFVTIDGVTYDKDMTRVLFCDKDKEGVYVMPETVETIDGKAFEDCDLLTEVVISPKVTEIVYYTFASCDNLQAVDLPAGLVSIGESVFYNTQNLTEIEMPDTLENIGNRAFKLSAIPLVTLPDSMQWVEYEAFAFSGLSQLDLGNGLQGIGRNAFKGTAITDVDLPDSLLEVGMEAFCDCWQLKALTIGSGLTYIDELTFANTALEEVVLPENIEFVGYGAFMNSALTNVVFENPAVDIGTSAFSYTNLKTLKLGDKTERISRYAFRETDITEIDIPDSVTRIVYGAFMDCESLADIRIPDSVMYIGAHIFDGTAWYDAQSDGVIYLNHIAYSWKGDMPEKHKAALKEGTTVIADNAFEELHNLRVMELPESLEVIGEQAFYGCTGLREIHIPAGVYNIGYGAFAGCRNLTVTVDENSPYFEVHDGMLVSKKGEIIWDPATEVVTNLYVDRYPNKRTYLVGEEFDPTGMVLSAYYRSGYLEKLTDGFEVHGFDSSVSGSCALSFSYNGAYTNPWDIVYVTVTDHVSVAGVKLSHSDLHLLKGETTTITAFVVPYDATNQDVVWESSDPSVVAVEGGVIVPLQPGEAIITVTTVEGKHQATCRVTVECAHNFTTEVPAKPSTCLQHGHGAYVICDECGVVIEGSDAELPRADHTGGVATCQKQAVCDVCKQPYGELADHRLVNVPAKPSTCIEHGHGAYVVCDECGIITEGSDAALPFADHTGGMASCVEKAVCDVCKQPYGEYGDHRLTGHEAVAPNHYHGGNIQYYSCDLCKKLFDDSVATNEIQEEDTKLPQIPHDFSGDWQFDGDQHWKRCSCGEVNGKTPHDYDSVCDEFCNTCGAKREAPHATSGACDTACNLCGVALDTTVPHSYDNACDGECNVCKETRDVEHTYSSEWDATCDVCGNVREVTFTGWASENGKWYYYQNGKLLKNQWRADSMGWCYLGADGAMMTNAWVRDSQGWCYVSGNGYIVKNNWVQDGGKWYFLNADGYMLFNTWQKDSLGWCYLGNDGAMMTNAWLKDSQGWCYVGANGYCLTDQWMQDSVGWVYLDANGRMVTSSWIKSGGEWYYLDANGYMKSNMWMRDSIGWCYLGERGAMVTNAWVKDSVGWCYLGADGYAVTNCWKKDSIGWCYLNSNGSMTKNEWVPDGGKWYYCDANGYMVTGTKVIGGTTYKFDANGVWLG